MKKKAKALLGNIHFTHDETELHFTDNSKQHLVEICIYSSKKLPW